MDEFQRQKLARQKVFNLTLASVMAQVGLLTVVVLGVALWVGLTLDAHYGTRPLWTIVLVVLSVPLTIGGMLWVVRRASHRLEDESPSEGEKQQ
ncbi:MAG TPA: AtpZ/AtpI family protein [Chloroflexi bacterium]|nr:AtpZ/AtpI family protein [Chloroflexota bacterium]